MPTSGLTVVAMARERIVLFVFYGANSKPAARRLQYDCPFGCIFGDYVNRMGYDVAVTRFFTGTLWSNGLVRRGISTSVMVAGSTWSLLGGFSLPQI